MTDLGQLGKNEDKIMTAIDRLQKQQKQKAKLHISSLGLALVCEMAARHPGNNSGPSPHPTACKS